MSFSHLFPERNLVSLHLRNEANEKWGRGDRTPRSLSRNILDQEGAAKQSPGSQEGTEVTEEFAEGKKVEVELMGDRTKPEHYWRFQSDL